MQEPLKTLVRTWEELATRGGNSTAYLTPGQIEKCTTMREGDTECVKGRARSPDTEPQQTTQAEAATDNTTVRLTAESAAVLTVVSDSATSKQQTARVLAAAEVAASSTAQEEAVFCLE